MSEVSDLAAHKNRTFAEIGRNVVLFQDIERMLKIVLNTGQLVATASQLQAWAGKVPAPYSKRMLGELIEPLITHHLTPAGPDDPILPASDEFVIAFQIRVELKEAQRADYRQRLEAMVQQRNEFMHHLLEWLRLDTIEGCQAACSRLQQQREAIRPLHRDIHQILRTVLEAQKDLPQMLERLVSDGIRPDAGESS